MCGRMNVVHDSLCPIISDFFGFNFSTPTNNNLSPSQTVATIVATTLKNNGDYSGYQQLDTSWGIQPSWSKKLLINAQGETVSEKTTFRQAFKTHRCLVPCSGWYEWRTENGKKQKYHFSLENGDPLLMAGIWYQEESPKLVTLTTTPNEKCAQYHKRMPVFILPEHTQYWFQSPVEQLAVLLKPISEEHVNIERA